MVGADSSSGVAWPPALKKGPLVGQPLDSSATERPSVCLDEEVSSKSESPGDLCSCL